MNDRIYNVLFLCTGNSARSILAEALLNKYGEGRFKAYSAGSFPNGAVHPMVLSVLNGLGFETAEFRSKSWDEFSAPGAPVFDFIFTVCDNAAGEICPIWPGHPMTAHWGIEDPAAVEDVGEREAFLTAFRYLQRRIDLFLELPLEAIDNLALKSRLREIGEGEGATIKASA
jgi:arsenate reductase (thioredoxin)